MFYSLNSDSLSALSLCYHDASFSPAIDRLDNEIPFIHLISYLSHIFLETSSVYIKIISHSVYSTFSFDLTM